MRRSLADEQGAPWQDEDQLKSSDKFVADFLLSLPTRKLWPYFCLRTRQRVRSPHHCCSEQGSRTAMRPLSGRCGLQTPLGRAAGGVTGGLLEGRAVGTGGGPALECFCHRDGRREEAEAGCSVADAHIPKQSESGEHGVGRGPRGSPDLTPDTTAAPVPESVPLRVPVRCHRVSSNCQHTGNGSSPNHTTWICFSYFW